MKTNKKTRFGHLSYESEEDNSDGNWLISYADMMTLLWGFFVIVSAFSVPSKAIIEKIKETTSKSMGEVYVKPFNEISDELQSVLSELNLESDAQIENLTDGIKITMKSGKFFESGSSNLPQTAIETLTRIGLVLKKQEAGFKILVEGHTDDVPINKEGVPSNWELSSNRASSVVRLFEKLGIDHSILRPIGFADVEPLINSSDLKKEELDDARAQNRRIVIRLQKTIPSRLKGVSQ